MVHKINGKFVTDIRTYGKKRILKPVKLKFTWILDKILIKENNEKEFFVTRKEIKNWVKKIYPYMVVKSGIINMVQVYLRIRGCKFPGNYNYILLTELFLE